MNWDEFFTLLAQAVIILTVVCVIGFVATAAGAGIIDAIKGKKDK